jgi:hypothetical protein
VKVRLFQGKKNFRRALFQSIAFSEFGVALRVRMLDELLCSVASKRPSQAVHCVKIMLTGMLKARQGASRGPRAPRLRQLFQEN